MSLLSDARLLFSRFFTTETKSREPNFLFADYFFENLLSWRLVAIEGRLGGGKTCLAVALARWLYTRGFVAGVMANFPIDPTYIPPRSTVVNSAVVLDEGWTFADSRKSRFGYEGYGAYARKLNMYLLTPSINRVDRRMRQITVRRDIDFWLLNAWRYKWINVDGDEGSFLLTNFESVFNVYDHRYIPEDDGGIKESMYNEIQALSGSMRKLYVVGPARTVSSPYANPMRPNK